MSSILLLNNIKAVDPSGDPSHLGQTEEQMVLQSEVKMYAGLTFLLLGANTQLALCIKKKQFERLRL